LKDAIVPNPAILLCMAKLRRGITLVLLLGLGAQAPPEYLSVPEWWGSIILTLKSKGETTSTVARETNQTHWDDQERVVFDVHLDARSPGPIVLRGTLDLQGLREEGRWQSWRNDLLKKTMLVNWVTGEGTSTSTIESPGEANAITTTEIARTKTRAGAKVDPVQMMGLHVDIKKGVYAFTLPMITALHDRDFPSREEWTSHTQEPNGLTHDDPGSSLSSSVVTGQILPEGDVEIDSHVVKVFDQKLPPRVDILKGSMAFKIKQPFKGKGKVDTQAILTWEFSPYRPPPIELELEAEGGGGKKWDEWRPVGGPNERTPGSQVILTATVVSRDAPLPDKPRRITLVLTQVSHEKGVCINFPPEGGAVADADLQFRQADNPGLKTFRDGVRIVDPSKPRIQALLSCLDYGAWGEVMAEAELESGRVILGHVKGKPQERLLRIPERPANSKIASVWKSPGADDADDDDLPAGDGQKGDGLTNYEEYRGFYVSGSWKQGDPAKKEFFVRNECGATAEPGITLFETITQLRVHRLADKELSADKVINFNHTEGPHLKVDQHGIRVVSEPSLGKFCQAHSRNPNTPIGTPKNVDFVGLGDVPTNVVQLHTPNVTTQGSYAAPSVAHELLHCCNVYHHGEEPKALENGVSWTQDDRGIWEGGVKIRVLDAAGNDISGKVSFPQVSPNVKQVFPSVWQGNSSGDVNCVMRYDTAECYTPQGAPTDRVRLLRGDEPVGGGLCTTPDATGTNLNPGRFGPCANGRGACSKQILVNDSAKAPAR
jgi:hypothetical protein